MMIAWGSLKAVAAGPARAIFLATGLVSVPSLAGAQTYNSTQFPVCIQVYAPMQYIDCHYASIPQCQATASGRAAMCVQNPYFNPGEPPVRRKRHRQG